MVEQIIKTESIITKSTQGSTYPPNNEELLLTNANADDEEQVMIVLFIQ